MKVRAKNSKKVNTFSITAKIMAVILAVLMLVLFSSCANSKSASEVEAIEGLSAKTDDLDKYSLYMVGEIQNTEKNKTVMLDMMRYLYNTHGVRDFAFQSPYVDMQVVNAVINGENDNKKWVAFTEATFGKDIIEWAQALPEDDRITFHGVDVNYALFTGVAKDYLDELAAEKITSEIEQMIEKLDAKLIELNGAQVDEEFLFEFTDFLDDMRFNKAKYAVGLSDELYNEYYLTLRNTCDGMVFQSDCTMFLSQCFPNSDALYRENSMTDSLTRVIENAGGKKVMFWGDRDRVKLNGTWKSSPMLGNRFAEKLGIENGGLASIIIYYDNSVGYDLATNKEFEISDELSKHLKTKTEEDIAFIELDKNEENDTLEIAIKESQYAILISDSNVDNSLKEYKLEFE